MNKLKSHLLHLLCLRLIEPRVLIKHIVSQQCLIHPLHLLTPILPYNLTILPPYLIYQIYIYIYIQLFKGRPYPPPLSPKFLCDMLKNQSTILSFEMFFTDLTDLFSSHPTALKKIELHHVHYT